MRESRPIMAVALASAASRPGSKPRPLIQIVALSLRPGSFLRNCGKKRGGTRIFHQDQFPPVSVAPKAEGPLKGRSLLRERIAFAGLLLLPAVVVLWIAFLVWWAGWMLGLWG